MLDKRARHALLEVHTWTGLALGLVLHAMFFFGALALFLDDLSCWEDPSQHSFGTASSFGDAFAAALPALPADTRTMSLTAPPDGSRVFAMWFEDPVSDRWSGLSVNPSEGTVERRDTHASQFLFSLHFLWHESAPALYYVSGIVAAFLLLAIVTGVLVHLRQLAPQFGRFRPETSPRVAITDLHKVLGVIGLPFQIVFAFTGAFLVLAPLLVRSHAATAFEGDSARVASARRSEPVEIEDAPPITGGLDAQIAAARSAIPGLVVDTANFDDFGEDDATIELQGPMPGAFAGEGTVAFEADDGAMVSVDGPHVETAVYAVRRYVTGLHYAKFGGASLRLLYAFLALATAATALSGTYIWILRREASGTRFLRAATEATATGSILATVCLLLAVRLVPAHHENRASIEEWVFFATWALVYLDSALAADLGRAFVRHLSLVAVALLALPFATTLVSSSGLVGSLLARTSLAQPVAGVELVAVAAGVGSLAIAILVARARHRSLSSPTLTAARPMTRFESETRYG